MLSCTLQHACHTSVVKKWQLLCKARSRSHSQLICWAGRFIASLTRGIKGKHSQCSSMIRHGTADGPMGFKPAESCDPDTGYSITSIGHKVSPSSHDSIALLAASQNSHPEALTTLIKTEREKKNPIRNLQQASWWPYLFTFTEECSMNSKLLLSQTKSQGNLPAYICAM